MEMLKLEQAVELLRKDKERKFNQSIDLIVNLRKFDLKKTQINTFVSIPHKIKDKKVCGFIESKSSIINTIQKSQFPIYKDKKKVKKLVKEYDFFIASAPNMPLVATTFGRVLGPAGKMPSPKLGILVDDSEKNVKELVERINKTIRVQTKEPSIKVSIGKLSMKDSELIENATQVYTLF
jgi:large subunit ribosomal protein L1